MGSVKSLRRAGGWCITLGIIAITAGVTLGVGCLVAGGKVLANTSK